MNEEQQKTQLDRIEDNTKITSTKILADIEEKAKNILNQGEKKANAKKAQANFKNIQLKYKKSEYEIILKFAENEGKNPVEYIKNLISEKLENKQMTFLEKVKFVFGLK